MNPETDRLARLEAAVDAMQQMLDAQFKRMTAALQAQLDYLAAARPR